jgi:hypothetical protein
MPSPPVTSQSYSAAHSAAPPSQPPANLMQTPSVVALPNVAMPPPSLAMPPAAMPSTSSSVQESAVFRLIKQEILQRLLQHVARGVQLSVDPAVYAGILADTFCEMQQSLSATGSIVISDAVLTSLMAYVDRRVQKLF